jgi:hypothetical protein
VRHVALFEERQQLVLGAMKDAHARVGIGPHHGVERVKPEFAYTAPNRRGTAPVDECAEHAAVAPVGQTGLDPRDIEP